MRQGNTLGFTRVYVPLRLHWSKGFGNRRACSICFGLACLKLRRSPSNGRLPHTLPGLFDGDQVHFSKRRCQEGLFTASSVNVQPQLSQCRNGRLPLPMPSACRELPGAYPAPPAVKVRYDSWGHLSGSYHHAQA